MPAHPARAILRATLRAARAWEAAASLHGDGVVRAREPVSRTAFASGGGGGTSYRLTSGGVYISAWSDGSLNGSSRSASPGTAYGYISIVKV